MTRIVAIPLGYLMNGIYSLVDNYALSIIIMTVIIRLIILPLYSMQLKSNEQMMAVQPKIKEIQAKYKDNPEKMNEKLQEIYEEHKTCNGMLASSDPAAYYLGPFCITQKSYGLYS